MFSLMEAVHSFAPLAARLAARADEIRPVDGAKATWDGFMALFVCAILHMLILLCEALHARAAADARLAAAPAVREGAARYGYSAFGPFGAAGCGAWSSAGARAAGPSRFHKARRCPVRDIRSRSRRSLVGLVAPPWLGLRASRRGPAKKHGLRHGIKHAYVVTIS